MRASDAPSNLDFGFGKCFKALSYQEFNIVVTVLKENYFWIGIKFYGNGKKIFQRRNKVFYTSVGFLHKSCNFVMKIVFSTSMLQFSTSNR